MIETYNLFTLSLLKGLGKVTLRKILNIPDIFSVTLDSANDYHEFINSIQSKYLFLKKYTFTKNDYQIAIDHAEDVYRISDKYNINIISLLDENYPKKLRTLVGNRGNDDSPIFLHYKGNLELHNQTHNHVAIIGTREPTDEGVLAGQFFAKKFCEEKFNIVSGLAKGCDTLAHKGALESSGITTAVLAHGLDRVYPKENNGLLEDILDSNGLAISEYHVGTPSLPNYFVERDRIQAGLVDATVVIQTGLKGGTMHAVNTTMINKKLLYAIEFKSTLNSEKIQGNNMLINTGKAIPLSSNNINTEIVRIKHVKEFRTYPPTLF